MQLSSIAMNRPQRDSIANNQENPYTHLTGAGDALFNLREPRSPFGADGFRDFVAAAEQQKLLDDLSRHDTAMVSAFSVFGFDCGPDWMASRLAAQFDDELWLSYDHPWRVVERLASVLAAITAPFAERGIPAGRE